ncbi:UNVERIFIED_ORG: anti-sigma factor RsiW [Arthrobacter sp. UYEF10]
MACVLAAASNPGLPGLMVWLFMGPYLALTGWAAALLGMATNVRLIGPVDGRLAPVTQAS